jgi:dTDP-4-dehydrorhamnose reductase
MRVLITGAGGQVGKALAQELAETNDLYLVTRNELDLANTVGIAPALDEIAPDLIINAAAYTAVDQAEVEKDLAFAINAEAVGVLGLWAAKNGAPVIHFSTDYVFDGYASEPYDESHPVNPLSVYGLSKAKGETLLQESGARCIIMRTCWVYSAVGKNFLKTMLRLAGEKDELTVVDDQIGTPTSASQIALFVKDILSERQGSLPDLIQRSCSLVHFSADGWTSWHGFATAIVERAKTLGAPLKASKVRAISSTEFKTAAQRPAFSRLSTARLQRVFSHQPETWQNAMESELQSLLNLVENQRLPIKQ